jgi:hypothetical protein
MHLATCPAACRRNRATGFKTWSESAAPTRKMSPVNGRIWDKVGDSVIEPPATATQAAPANPTAREAVTSRIPTRVYFRLLDLLSVFAWVYVVLTLFVVNVDRKVVDAFGLDPGLLDYKLFALIGVAAVLVLAFGKRVIIPVLYVVFFPLIVALWKMPVFLYRRRSFVLAFAALNVALSFFSSFKGNVVWFGVWTICAVVAYSSHTTALVTVAIVGMAAAVARSYIRLIRASFFPSRFVKLQERLVVRVVEHPRVQNAMTLDDDLRSTEIVQYDQQQLTTLAQSLSIAVTLNKGILLYAFLLDRYRRSASGLIVMVVSYVWVFLVTVLSVSLINQGLLNIDPSGYRFDHAPDFVTVLHYSFASLYLTGISNLDGTGTSQQVVSVASGLVGIVLLATIIGGSVFSWRRSQEQTAIGDTIDTLRAQSRALNQRIADQYEVNVDDAIKRLEAMKAGFATMIVMLASRIPEGFDREGDDR